MRAMRVLQIAGFLLGAACFLTSIGFIGKQTGEDLWKVGIAFMISDIPLILLWPAGRRRRPLA